MAAIYSNGGNCWNILGFNFTKRDALSSVYKISMIASYGDYIKLNGPFDLSSFPNFSTDIGHIISKHFSQVFISKNISILNTPTFNQLRRQKKSNL